VLKLRRPLVFFDLETTGVDPNKDRIVQIAAKSLTVHDNELVAEHTFESLVNPEMPIPAQASDVHHIYDKDVEKEPTFRCIAAKVYALFKDRDWAGYNSNSFDIPLLLNELRRCGHYFDAIPRTVDCFQIFKKQQPHTLTGAVAYYTNRDHSDSAHDAMNDVDATIDVFKAQLCFMGDDIKTVGHIDNHFRQAGQLDLAGKLRHKDGAVVLTFGKHIDTPVQQVPASYMQWCIKESIFFQDALDILKDVFMGLFVYDSRHEIKNNKRG